MSPSGSEPPPVSENGVRYGIVYGPAGTVTDGAVFPVACWMTPWLYGAGPPLAVCPTKPDNPALRLVSVSGVTLADCPSVPPNVTWNPWLDGVPAPAKPLTIAVAPTGRMPA